MTMLYPNFSEEENMLLGEACVDEIKYYERMHLSHVPIIKTKLGKTIVSGRAKDSQELDDKLYGRHPGFEESMLKAKEMQIKKYKRILQKLSNKEKEFSDDEIHGLKTMLQEAIAMIKRHVVVKLQVDGSVSQKHARLDVNTAFSAAIYILIESYGKLANKLAAIDTIPGDGFSEPKLYRIEP